MSVVLTGAKKDENEHCTYVDTSNDRCQRRRSGAAWGRWRWGRERDVPTVRRPRDLYVVSSAKTCDWDRHGRSCCASTARIARCRIFTGFVRYRQLGLCQSREGVHACCCWRVGNSLFASVRLQSRQRVPGLGSGATSRRVHRCHDVEWQLQSPCQVLAVTRSSVCWATSELRQRSPVRAANPQGSATAGGSRSVAPRRFHSNLRATVGQPICGRWR